MLKQRVITAIVMLLVLLPAMFYPSPLPFGAVACILICAAAWEWARLNQAPEWLSYASAVACGLLCAVFWWQGALHVPYPSPSMWMLIGAAWVLAALASNSAIGLPRWSLNQWRMLVVLVGALLLKTTRRVYTPAVPSGLGM